MPRAVRSPLFLALGALAILLVAMEAARPCFFLHDDNATWFAGAYAHDFRVLTETGEIAEVNFFQYGGEPFIGQGQTGVFYPPIYLGAALARWISGDLRGTIDWLAAIHLALALAGFYAWLRQGGVAAPLAALGGLAWALNPFVLILGASWITVTYAAAWLPWLFWAVERVCAMGDGGIVRGPSTALGSAATGKDDLLPRSAQDDDLLKRGFRRGGKLTLIVRPVALAAILGLFMLQGYVQWVINAMLFAGMYAALRIVTGGWGIVGGPSTALGSSASERERFSPRCARDDDLLKSGLRRGRRESRWLFPICALVLAVWVAVVLAAPLLVPMVRALSESAARARPLSLAEELFYRVQPADLLAAQVGFFRRGFLFDASTALFFCPALVLFPLAIVRFARGDGETRRRLFPLMVLAVMALVLSGSGYFLLNIVPLLQRFRWPFKMFLDAEFFLLAALVWSLASIGSRKSGETVARWSTATHAVLVAVVVLQVAVALANHDTNFLSQAGLPTSANPLPAGMDVTLGRVIAVDDHVPVREAYRYFMYAYGTYFEVPSLGGYNPLVSRRRLDFSLGLDVPNVFVHSITPKIRAGLESRAVRYWVVDPDSPRRAEIEALEGVRLLAGGIPADYFALSGLDAGAAKAQRIALGYLISPPWGSRIEGTNVGGFAQDCVIDQASQLQPIANVPFPVDEFDAEKLPAGGIPADYFALSGLDAGAAKTQGVALGYLISPPWGSRIERAKAGTFGPNPVADAPPGLPQAGEGSRIEGTNVGAFAPNPVADASPDFPQAGEGSRMGGTPPVSSSRPLIFEDTHAEPMAFDAGAPMVALPLRYAGNSMLIQLEHDSLVAVSVGPTDGWWYRVDGGAWQKPDYRDWHLFMRVSSASRDLEVRYRDPWLRLVWRKLFRPSLIATPVIALVTFGQRWLLARHQRARGLTFGSS